MLTLVLAVEQLVLPVVAVPPLAAEAEHRLPEEPRPEEQVKPLRVETVAHLEMAEVAVAAAAGIGEEGQEVAPIPDQPVVAVPAMHTQQGSLVQHCTQDRVERKVTPDTLLTAARALEATQATTLVLPENLLSDMQVQVPY